MIIGDYIVYSIYISWGINGLVIGSVSVGEIYGNLCHLYYMKLRWKFACLRPKMPKQKREKKLSGVQLAEQRDKWSNPVSNVRALVNNQDDVLKSITEESVSDKSASDSSSCVDYQKDGISNLKIPVAKASTAIITEYTRKLD